MKTNFVPTIFSGLHQAKVITQMPISWQICGKKDKKDRLFFRKTTAGDKVKNCQGISVIPHWHFNRERQTINL
jgi:hypothetical protein